MDLVNGTMIISTGLFIFLVGLAIYGLVISGAMLATAIGLIAQKRENVSEIRRFNTMMLQIQESNRLWFGNQDMSGPGFEGLSKALDEMESEEQMGGEIHAKDGDAPFLVNREFLEDRD